MYLHQKVTVKTSHENQVIKAGTRHAAQGCPGLIIYITSTTHVIQVKLVPAGHRTTDPDWSESFWRWYKVLWGGGLLAKAEEEISIEGISHSSCHCPNQITAGTCCHNLNPHPSSHVSALAVSHVQFQYMLFRNPYHSYTWLLLWFECLRTWNIKRLKEMDT